MSNIAIQRPNRSSSTAGHRPAAAPPIVLVMIVVGLFLPEELSFYLFGLRLTAVRLLFLLLTPVLLVKAGVRLSTGRLRILPSDVLVILAGFWLIYAPANIDDLPSALNHAGPNVLEFCIGYMSTRVLLNERGQALQLVNVLCVAISVAALLGALDPLTNQFFVHDLAAQLTGPMSHSLDWRSNPDAYRLGLLRAAGPLEHPILFGFVCSIGLILAVAMRIRYRLFCALSCAVGAILAFSSAPMQGLFMGLGLLAYDRFLLKLRRRWLLMFVLAAGGLVLVFSASNNPVGFAISNLTFNPESGYYRQWTWETVTAYVSQSPIFGLGLETVPDEINHSVDSLWLVLSMQAGYPGAVLIGLSMMSAAATFRRGAEISSESILASTLGIVLFLTMFIAFTVHLWGCAWILAALLLGAKAHLSELLCVQGGSASSARAAHPLRNMLPQHRSRF